ncbi:hypothetical protein F8178_10750 [Haloechinothrix sp. LS1_15]|nr:hypothetical protein [Haloechinothrix sp. LS1_15]
MPAIHIRGVKLDTNPALVLAVLLFYARNPALREELATDSALQRVRSANLVHSGSNWEWRGGVPGMSYREFVEYRRRQDSST